MLPAGRYSASPGRQGHPVEQQRDDDARVAGVLDRAGRDGLQRRRVLPPLRRARSPSASAATRSHKRRDLLRAARAATPPRERRMPRSSPSASAREARAGENGSAPGHPMLCPHVSSSATISRISATGRNPHSASKVSLSATMTSGLCSGVLVVAVRGVERDARGVLGVESLPGPLERRDAPAATAARRPRGSSAGTAAAPCCPERPSPWSSRDPLGEVVGAVPHRSGRRCALGDPGCAPSQSSASRPSRRRECRAGRRSPSWTPTRSRGEYW